VAPEHGRRRRKAREDTGEEGRGDGAVLLVAAEAANLVQRTAREPATRQRRVDRADAERQHAVIADAAAREFPHPLLESRQPLLRWQCPARCRAHHPFLCRMFIVCS
jgi:hypothetical protein